MTELTKLLEEAEETAQYLDRRARSLAFPNDYGSVVLRRLVAVVKRQNQFLRDHWELSLSPNGAKECIGQCESLARGDGRGE